MSRIGRNPIQVPAGVTITVADSKVTVKGPKGELSLSVSPRMTVELKDGVLTFSRPSDEKEDRAAHGLTRTLINNMVVGVTEGYAKTLEINGVGYKAEKQGTKLVLNLGYSHPVIFEEGDGISFTTPNNTTIVVSGIDKQKVGEMAAKVRAKRPPEPYLGKGIKYAGEHIRRKAGKAGK